MSHVLSGKRPTSATTRQRVEAVVARLGYRPNAMAQSLVWRRSFALGLIIPDISNPYFPALARGVEDYVRRRGYTLVLGNTDYDESRERGYLDLLRANQLAGVIYCLGEAGGCMTEQLLSARQEGRAVVLVHEEVPGVPTVCVDNYQGGRLAAEHLRALGHSAVGLISALPMDAAISQREAGFRETMAAGPGSTPRDVVVAYGDHQIEGGRRAAAELLKRTPRLTALFVLNDLMALGALQAATTAGRKVPEELSIVGFDDIPFAALASPPLTTVRQPIRELGERAAELLLRMVENGPLSDIRQMTEQPAVVLPATLVVRGSSGPAPR